MLPDKIKTAVFWLKSRWWMVLPLSAVIWYIYEHLFIVSDPLNLTNDSALFYYSGRQWVENGRVPYRHLWDVKPPLIHETTAVMAVVTDGDPVAMYLIGNILNITALLGGLAVSMCAVRELTDSKLAGAMTGLSCLALPWLFARTVTGLRPKYLLLLPIGLVLLAGVRQRWVIAAAIGAVAAGLWQPAMLVLLTVLTTISWLVNYGDLSPEIDIRAGVGVLGVVVIMTVPIVIGGAFPEMVVQTIAAPLLTEDGGVGLRGLFTLLNPTLLTIAVVGTVGIGVRSTHPVRWWPAVFLFSFGIITIGSDYDGTGDLIPLSFIVAIGVGIAIGVARPPEPKAILADPRTWLLLLLGVTIWASKTPMVPIRTGGAVRDTFLSNSVEPKCHIRLSGSEKQMMALLDHPEDAATCWRPDWWPW